MTKRHRRQYLGDLGEAEVFKELLHIGVSINYLTQSDSGWDLHLRSASDGMAGDLKAYKFCRERFSKLLHLWSLYPNVLLSAHCPDALLHNGAEVNHNAAFELLVDVAVGWLTFAGLSYTEGAAEWERGVSVFYRAVDDLNLGKAFESKNTLQSAIAEHQGFHHDLGLPVATYSLEAAAPNCLDDALRMLHLMFVVP
jgi:hypothetical protein